DGGTRVARLRGLGGRPTGEIILGRLGRAAVLAPADLERDALVVLLESDAGQGVGAAEVARVDCYHEAAVGVRRFVLRQAHAVGAERPRVAHARHDVAAGAHAEREQVVRPVGDQRIARRAELLLQAGVAVVDAVDRLLRLLDADA